MSNNINKIYKILLVFVFFGVTASSCDFIFEKDKSNSQILNNVKTNKDEASLLLKASKANINTVKLLSAINYSNGDSIVKQTAKTLEKQQIQVLNIYENIAEENVVSIPHYFDMRENKEIKNDSVSDKINIEGIVSSINTQIESIEKLHSFSENRATESQMIKALEILKLSSETSKTLGDKILGE